MTTVWPAGYHAAAAFTFDVDAESAVLSENPANSSRMSLMGHQSYGPRIGVPRLLDMLGRQGITATFFVPGFTADCYPDVVRRIVGEGHEVGHHGYLHEPMQGISASTEASYIDRGLDALDRVGVRPSGYRAPWWELNWHSPDLLLERGFRYDSSLFDDDRPYRFRGTAGASSLVEIPVNWALDDWQPYGFYPGWTGSGVIESPESVRGRWLLEAQALHAEGGSFVLTNHPFLSGRPARVLALERLISEVKALPGMWVTTLDTIARHVEATDHDIRTVRRIEAAEFETRG